MVAVAFRPLRGARAGRGRPALQPRRATTPGAGWPSFLERLRAGAARSRGCRGRAARVARRPGARAPVLPARRASSTSTRAARAGRGRAGRRAARPSRSSAAASRSAMVLHDPPRPTSIPACCARSSRPAVLRSRSRACGSSCAGSCRRSRPPGPGSSPRRTRSAGGSSATSTTAPSSGWSRSASRCATPSTSSRRPRPRTPAGRSTAPSPRSPSRSTSCASCSRGLPPSQLDAGLAPALRELAARAPLPVHVDGAERAVRPRRRGRRLLHRLRGAHERRQARPRHQRSISAPGARTGGWSSASPTTASAARRRRRAPGCAA